MLESVSSRGVVRIGAYAIAVILVVTCCVRAPAAVTLDEIAACNEQARRKVDGVTGRITLVVSKRRDKGAINRHMDDLSARPGASPAQLEALRHARALVLSRAVIRERREQVFDAGQARTRTLVQDLRDFAALGVQEKIAPSHREEVLTSGASLQDRKTLGRLFVAHRQDGSRWLTLELDGPDARMAHDPPVGAGILAPEYFGHFKRGVNTIATTRDGENELVTLTSVDRASGVRHRVLFDPRLGYRFRLVEARNDAGQLVAGFKADDYRVTNGIPYPFIQSEERYDPSTGRLLSSQEISVESAAFGMELTDADFAMEIPKGTTISNLLCRHHVTNRFGEDRVMTLGELISFALDVQAVEDAPEGGSPPPPVMLSPSQPQGEPSGARPLAPTGGSPPLPLQRRKPWEVKLELPSSRPATQATTQPSRRQTP